VSIGVHPADPDPLKKCGTAYSRTVNDPSAFRHVDDLDVRSPTTSDTGRGGVRTADGGDDAPRAGSETGRTALGDATGSTCPRCVATFARLRADPTGVPIAATPDATTTTTATGATKRA
jgi:hypothetical protein